MRTGAPVRRAFRKALDSSASLKRLEADEETYEIPTPTRVFLEKRLQAIENKGRELAKEGKEAASSCKQKS